MVVAQSREAARDAADLIEVEFEELPAIIGFDKALAAGAVALHPNIPDNICFDFEYGDAAKTKELIEQPTHVVRLMVESPRVAPTPMEPRAALAVVRRPIRNVRNPLRASGRLCDARCARDHHERAAGKNPREHGRRRRSVRSAHRAVLRISAHAVHGQALGRPIKWLSTRSEDFLTDNHGRAIRLEGELAFNSSGRFIALRTEWLCDSGAYLSQAGAFTNSFNGMTIGAGVYQVDALYGRHRQVMTNTAPTNAYRGAGRPDAVYIVERLVDAAAAVLDLDPLEIRRRNVIRRERDALPHLDRQRVRQRRFRRAHRQGRAGVAMGQFCAAPEGGGTPRRVARHRLLGISGTLGRRLVPKDQVAIRFEDNASRAVQRGRTERPRP